MPRTLRRARNLFVRLRERLPSQGLAVSPAIDNDLFQAHLALYRFAAVFAPGRRCLDLGCGTGYGAAHLLACGAAEVVGIDADARAIGYARRRFGGPNLRFEQRPAAQAGPLGPFDLVTAINLLVHLEDPEEAVTEVAGLLRPHGVFVASVPPILDGQTMDLFRSLPGHRAHLYLWDWEDLLKASFGCLRLFRQQPPAGRLPDLADPGPARLAALDYAFEELALADLYDAGSMSAVFVATEPRPRPAATPRTPSP
jgi:SAM-dependent methyltransferase